MERPPDTDVGRFLGALPDETRAIVLALRRMVRRTEPTLSETLLWGALSYHRPWIGGRVKGAVCQISVGRRGVRLEFIHGVRLSDPDERLQGGRLSKRYVPIATMQEADEPALAELVREAAALDPARLV